MSDTAQKFPLTAEDIRRAALGALTYANAATPGHGWQSEPTEAGLHKMRPVFLCCSEHAEPCRPSGPVVDCKLADALHPGRESALPAFVCGVDFGMSSRVGPAWFVREWLPGLQLVRALH